MLLQVKMSQELISSQNRFSCVLAKQIAKNPSENGRNHHVAIFACGEDYLNAIQMCKHNQISYISYDAKTLSEQSIEIKAKTHPFTIFEMTFHKNDHREFIGHILHLFTDIVICYLRYESPHHRLASQQLQKIRTSNHQIDEMTDCESIQTQIYLIPIN
jgi:hypothetical protein